MRRVWTKERLEFLKSICNNKSSCEIAALCTEKFGIKITREAVRSCMCDYKIKSGYKYDGQNCRLFTDEQVKWLTENRVGQPFAVTTEKFNEHFGTDFSVSQVTRYCHAHHLTCGVDMKFKKGNVSFNKGRKGWCAPGCEKSWFTKGHTPHNAVPINTEVVTEDGYIKVKVAEPNVWKLKHRIVWEKENGPVPENYCIVMLDGNRQNTALENLVMIKRGELAVMNHQKLYAADTEINKAGITIAKLKCQIRKMEKAEKNEVHNK